MLQAGGISAGGIAGAKLADGGVTEAKLATGSVTSAKIADGAVGTADLAAKSATRAKLADALFPLFAVEEVSKQYTIAAGAVMSVNVGDVPAKSGYIYIGTCGFNSGQANVVVASVAGRYLSVKNTSSSSVTATAKMTFLYVRS